ncbi:hypothetical protein TorRG33x02_219030 [Trema orientale]|uniref:Glycosyltransferase 61 catalytic domain-containing protein n=1 Tax=Trema orientale TaxID=63057 RepID=A0A2P5E9P8_TREOI|nr:hypothetical protein TorRG33x02_219030 [Trema orientale]
MLYDSILARSFSRHEQKRLGYGAIVCCLLIVLFFCTVFKPYLGPLPAAYLNLQVSMGSVGLKMLAVKATNNSEQIVKSMHEINDFPKVSSNIIERTSKDASDDIQGKNSTSEKINQDLRILSSNRESKNVSNHDLQEKDSTKSINNDQVRVISSNEGSKNLSHDDLQEKNSTSSDNHYDSGVISKGYSRNVSNNNNLRQQENSTNNISVQHHDDSGNVTKNYSTTNFVNLQAENSNTTPQHNAETLIEEVVTKKIPLPIICNSKESRSEYCEIETNVRIVGKSSSVSIVSSPGIEVTNSSWSVRPYARKGDATAMSQVKRWSIVQTPEKGPHEIPECTRKHSVPALLFSLGGYVGNNFHEYTDVVIPLFITARKYNGEVQFLVSDRRTYFVEKYRKLLKGLSNYEIIDMDRGDDQQQVHCFPSATIGLKRHREEMAIDPKLHSYSMKDFRDFLRNTYSLKKEKAIQIHDNSHRRKPRLLVVARRRTRAFTNVGEIVKMAKSLGYRVIVAEANSNLDKFGELVNSCDVLMGVHGAGLTNIVFLPENAVFIQILPIGGFDWIATHDFALPARSMNLRYLEYKIEKEESTLIRQYPLDHAVFTDPYSIGKNWEDFKAIFLEKQCVNLDVNRFKPTLVKALQLLHKDK